MPNLSLLLATVALAGSEPNPPKWPSGVKVLRPGNDEQTQTIINNVFKTNGGQVPAFNGQFTDKRFALMFMPGTYNLDVRVGYYTSVIGLGESITDTSISNVYSENGSGDYTQGALSNFWRSAENFHSVPTRLWNGHSEPSMMWAVSQASPLRRVSVAGGLDLWEGRGYSSGGYLSDCTVSGSITTGSQQQWYSRNVNLAQWVGGVWNIVFQGTPNTPPTSCQSNKCLYSNLQSTPVIAEKPFISSPDGTKFNLHIPQIEYNKVGASTEKTPTVTVGFENVYVTKENDTAKVINKKLNAGLHIILSPGIYSLDEPILVQKPDTVVLGLGFPTLISTNGHPAIVIAGGIGGVRVSGILLEAGKKPTKSLLLWGDSRPSTSSFMHDVFARVGGPTNQYTNPTQVKTMIVINSPNVVIDNSWLWRADHDITGNVVNSNNPCLNGLIVNGDNVTAYGLAVEHTLEDLVQWNGENGKIHFYQSELPYDVTQQQFGDQGFVSLRVASNITKFTSHGMGAYSFFRDHSVAVHNGFLIPSSPEISCTNTFTIWLSGKGQITHVLNGQGESVNSTFNDKVSPVCSF